MLTPRKWQSSHVIVYESSKEVMLLQWKWQSTNAESNENGKIASAIGRFQYILSSAVITDPKVVMKLF